MQGGLTRVVDVGCHPLALEGGVGDFLHPPRTTRGVEGVFDNHKGGFQFSLLPVPSHLEQVTLMDVWFGVGFSHTVKLRCLGDGPTPH